MCACAKLLHQCFTLGQVRKVQERDSAVTTATIENYTLFPHLFLCTLVVN